MAGVSGRMGRNEGDRGLMLHNVVIDGLARISHFEDENWIEIETTTTCPKDGTRNGKNDTQLGSCNSKCGSAFNARCQRK